MPPLAVDLGISMPSSFTRNDDHPKDMPAREQMRNDNGSTVLTNLGCMVGALVLIFVLLVVTLLVALFGR